MIVWLSTNIAVVTGITVVSTALLGFIWKLFVNWINLNYIPRKEVVKMFSDLETSFSDDLTKSSEAGAELSRFINSQLQVLQHALLDTHRRDHD